MGVLGGRNPPNTPKSSPHIQAILNEADSLTGRIWSDRLAFER